MRPIGSFDPKLTTLHQRARRAFSYIYDEDLPCGRAGGEKADPVDDVELPRALTVAAAVAVAKLCAGREQGAEQAVSGIEVVVYDCLQQPRGIDRQHR